MQKLKHQILIFFQKKPLEKVTPYIKYYTTWGGYSIRKKPQFPIDEKDIDQHKGAIYKAFYDEWNRLSKFEKYYKNVFQWSDEYEYWEQSEKVKKRISLDAKKNKNEHFYDKRGKEILIGKPNK